LSIAVEYSTNGISWTLVAIGAGYTGTLDVPVFQLGGSHTARVRVSASNGFSSGVVTSTVFSVASQPPRPYIAQPAPAATPLEGQRLVLRGGALDNQDERVTGANPYGTPGSLHWSSNRDGDLGTGSELGVFLSVGPHDHRADHGDAAQQHGLV
jgi:hypothetical protein